MKRRTFIAGLGGAAAIVSSSRPFAQKTGEMPLITVVGIDPDQKVVEAFDRGMRAVGYINDGNARVDYRWSGSDPQLGPTIVTEVVSSNPSVIVAIGSPNTIALRRRTSTIPIVFAVVSDPVYQGIVTSFAHPGSNVTGFSYFDTGVGGKWLQVLREIAPQTTQFVSMFSPTNSPGKFFLQSIEDAARSLNVEALRMPVQNDDEIRGAFEQLAGANNIALLFPSDPFTFFRSAMIATLAAKHRIPAMYPARRFADDGGLVAYGPDIYDEIYLAASYVDRILEGAKPGDLPVQQPTKYTLIINLRAAKALDLPIPATLLARADEVIE
jgi:putative tryptophan/tyrosine transport system substrate-binding protein